MISDSDRMTIFRYDPTNKSQVAPPDQPTDSPPRYVSIGFFTGSGGVTFDSDTKDVTVINHNQTTRSQISVRSMYALNPDTKTYWAGFDNQTLAAPIIQTIDFFAGPPDDIFNTSYPENIVLAFYASTCGSADKSLCPALFPFEPPI